ncbi:FtsH protease activity modulator HflK [Chitinimonas lacunae]|uniref:Protein HflK n=1 Tax=Chitinimonas lacunae TaxID=1963018 RepID=A0ABV8MMD4_9NEIS
MSQPDPQWGRRRNDGPPDLDEIIREYFNKLKQFFGGKPNQPGTPPGSGAVLGGVGVVAALIGLIWLGSGFYSVDVREQAVVLRFGRYLETTDAGLRWRMPWPIESHEIVNLSEIRSVEIGARGDTKRQNEESLMLTQDQNIIDMQLEVQYDIKDAEDFLFNNATANRDATDLVKQAAETAIREVVGRNKVDFVLNEGRAQIAAETTRLMQSLLDHYRTGVQVSRVNINDVQAPEPVQAAFADAVKAGQDKVKLTNEGTAYANTVVPKADGDAAQLIKEAEGYKQSVIARAEGDAARFRQVVDEYNKAPQVMRDRLYLEAMQQILTNSSKVLVDQKSGGNSMLYLPLDKLLQQSALPAAPAAQPAVDPATAARNSIELPTSTSPELLRPKVDLSIRGEREGR